MGIDVRWDAGTRRVVLKTDLVRRAILLWQQRDKPFREWDVGSLVVDAECFVGEMVAVVNRGAAGALRPCEFVLEDIDELGFVIQRNEVAVHQDAGRGDIEFFHRFIMENDLLSAVNVQSEDPDSDSDSV